MEANLELAKTKLIVRHLAHYSDLRDAESLLNGLRETVTFLERRIAREKSLIRKTEVVVLSAVEA